MIYITSCIAILIIYSIAGYVKRLMRFFSNLLIFTIDISICTLFFVIRAIFYDNTLYIVKLVPLKMQIAEKVILYLKLDYLPFVLPMIFYIAAYYTINKLIQSAKMRLLVKIILFLNIIITLIATIGLDVSNRLCINQNILNTKQALSTLSAVEFLYMILLHITTCRFCKMLSWKLRNLINKSIISIHSKHKLYHFYGLILGAVMILVLIKLSVLALIFNKISTLYYFSHLNSIKIDNLLQFT